MTALRIAAIVVAVGAYFVRLPAAWVERYYSCGLYAALQPPMTSFSNHVPFALFDVIVFGGAALVAALLARSAARSVRQRSLRPASRTLLHLVVAASVGYLAFLAMWGLNYQRQPLTERLDFTTARPSSAAVERLADEALREVNGLRADGRAGNLEDWDALTKKMRPMFADAQSRLLRSAAPVAGVPKRSLMNYYFERAGVSGMTDPFFLETLVDRSLLPFERPFVLAHEWAHLAGYADESEANFVGWLVCVHAEPAVAYSGWLYLYMELVRSVPPTKRRQLIAALEPGPRADLEAIARRARRIHPVLGSVAWRLYDRYLKTNKVADGVASYDRALAIVLGTTFMPGWTPVLR